MSSEEVFSQLEKEDEADRTGPGDSWAGGAVSVVGPMDSEAREDSRGSEDP